VRPKGLGPRKGGNVRDRRHGSQQKASKGVKVGPMLRCTRT
jgi:hypothetical protein